MAIDTRNKRASAGSLLGLEILPTADGVVGAADRAQVGGLYAGIAIAAAVAPVIMECVEAGGYVGGSEEAGGYVGGAEEAGGYGGGAVEAGGKG